MSSAAATVARAVSTRPLKERYRYVLLGAGLVGPVLLIAVIAMISFRSSVSFREYGIRFLWARDWVPNHNVFGALPFIYGTLVTSVLGLLLAIPVGVAVAVFLAEPGLRWLKGPIGTAIELLAAIPSVVYGLWALFVMAPFVYLHISSPAADHLGSIPIFGPPAQLSAVLPAALVLTIMVLPTLSAVSRDVIRAVPSTMREASYALGTTWWETTWRVILPAARAGITGAVILAFGRAVGETIAVTMVIGNRAQILPSLLQPGYTLASVIANEFVEANGDLYISSLIELGLILILLTLLLNVVALVLIRSVQHR